MKPSLNYFPPNLPLVQAKAVYGRYGLTLRSGGFCRFDTFPTNHPHMHTNFHELCLVIDGRGTFVHGEEQFSLSPGSLFFSEKNVSHEISSFKTRNLYLVFFVVVIGEHTLSLSSNSFDAVLHRFMLGHSLAIAGCNDLLEYVRLICRPGETAFEQFRRQRLTETFIFDALDRLSVQKSASSASRDRQAAPDVAGRAAEFIESNLGRRFSVAALARACSCSERHLRRVFRKATGKSIIETINERKASLAAQQLLMRFTVAQVAESLHISSGAHFCRQFKRYTGMTPKQFQIANSPPAGMREVVFKTKRAVHPLRGSMDPLA